MEQDMIDKYTVLAEKLSTNGKSPDSLIDTLKTLSPIEREKVISVLRWIDTNYDLEPNGGSLDFIVDCLQSDKDEIVLTGWSEESWLNPNSEYYDPSPKYGLETVIKSIKFPVQVELLQEKFDNHRLVRIPGLNPDIWVITHFTYTN